MAANILILIRLLEYVHQHSCKLVRLNCTSLKRVVLVKSNC